MTTDTKTLAAELEALASKAIHAAMWGHATVLEPDDVRMLQKAAKALEGAQ
ncbi:hypothetical protein [Lysobacter olei]